MNVRIFSGAKVPELHCLVRGDCDIVVTNQLETMSNDTKDSCSNGNDLLKNSSLYREFQAEREEILRHKWIESEKAGKDIGFERALTDWIVKHKTKWRKNRQQASAKAD